MQKKWYDYLWIVSLTYLVLGFFNILFAWLGLFCFFTPLIIAIAKGTKGYCNRYCGRGQLFSLLGGRFGLSLKKDIPRGMKSKAFRYGFLIFFFAMFFLMLWNTYAGWGEQAKIAFKQPVNGDLPSVLRPDICSKLTTADKEKPGTVCIAIVNHIALFHLAAENAAGKDCLMLCRQTASHRKK